MKATSKTIDFKFPINGLNNRARHAQQPDLTTRSMLNMWPRARNRRLIGGPRHGTSKFSVTKFDVSGLPP